MLASISKLLVKVGGVQAALKAPKATIGEMRAAHIVAQATVAEAEAEIARLAAARPELLISGDDATLEEHDRAAAAAERSRERANAMLPALAARVQEGERAAALEAAQERRRKAIAIIRAADARVAKEMPEVLARASALAECIGAAHGEWAAELDNRHHADLPQMEWPQTLTSAANAFATVTVPGVTRDIAADAVASAFERKRNARVAAMGFGAVGLV